MSEITLIVGGRHYAISCETGQEEHVRRLAAMIDARLSRVSGTATVANDAKNILFAALILADELEEARSGTGTVVVGGDDARRAAEILESVADVLEKTASTLER